MKAFSNKKKVRSYREFLYILPFIILVAIFSYYPLYGWAYAFYDYVPPNQPTVAEPIFKWFQKLAEQGNEQGQIRLGLMYEFGRGVPKDLYQAFTWYKKSAEQGNALCQSQIGEMYYLGKGVEKNYEKA